MQICYEDIETGVGPLRVGVHEDGRLVRTFFLRGRHKCDMTPDWADAMPDGAARRVAAQLCEYFAGERRSFDLPLDLQGSPFQNKVWRALLDVPFGETASYGDIARRIGAPGLARAVGRANATNPIPVVVPCHRIVGSDRSLTGYGGGLHIKRYLLELEGVLPGTLFSHCG
ncbi:MAG: methylated-DNA--[protein]-cysteine S-methyltransferase [Gammaproteobacteria bacterium]|nr:methylated-DNA--[protein]-cysteine S-methyltransferase [Gammaproteobacteria bacterium]